MHLAHFGFVALLLMVFQAAADEPYKRMLDDPMAFTGTETLGSTEAQTEYRIGVFAPDGDDHPVGRDLVRGVVLAVEQANASGGVNGKPLRIVRRWADDPWGAGAKEVVRMVFSDRVWALIGGPDGPTTHVAQQVATKAHLPLIAPISSDPSLTQTRVPWIFRLPPDDAAQAEALVNNALAPRDLEAVGVLVSADHEGRTFADELVAAMERRRVAPVFELAVDAGAADSGSIARRVGGFSPDGLVMRLEPGAVRRVLAALQTAGIDCPVFLPWIPGLHLVEYPPRYDGDVIQVAPFKPIQECGPYLKMVQSGIRRDGAKPTASMVYGFDAANLVINALRSGAGGRVELQKRLSGSSGFVGASGPIEWDNGGGNTTAPVVIEVSRQ
ncbi:MAG: ABC transporter substrate-binding protein [Thermoanaerobaculales bacterium]